MANQAQYGFVNLQDAFDRLVTVVGVSVVEAAVQRTIAQYNATYNAFFNTFTRRTTDFQTIYRTFGSSRSQSMDADGRALPIKGFGQYTLAWPIFRGGNAWGTSWEAGLKMTVGHVNETVDRLIQGDQRWVRDHMLAALFTNVNYTFPDEEHGALTIVPLANGDAQTYLKTGGGDPAEATAQHYLAQAAAIADITNPYVTLYNLLSSYPENNGADIIAMIPTNLVATTEALATFYAPADPNLRVGSGVTVLSGTPSFTVPGTFLGRVQRVWVYEWKQLPDNYILAFAQGAAPAVALREDPLAALQGFNLVGDRDDFPWTEHQYRRKAGFGIWNRLGAAVMRIGNGAYAIPAGYTAPIA